MGRLGDVGRRLPLLCHSRPDSPQDRIARFLADLADGAPFDVVHVDTVGLMPHAAAFGDLPLVLNHHNIESQMLHRRAERDPGVMRRLYCRREAAKLERYEREACRRAAVNITVSALDAERLLALVPGVRARVVENGVDIEYFHPARTRGRAGSLVFAGTMNWYPNQEEQLKKALERQKQDAKP